jgi:4-aminobutyrate aminotransferase/4-aminobutyrate aminotransferase/(S)-3-amino-2-methylpropionate transaminase
MVTGVSIGAGRHRVIQWSAIQVRSAAGSWIEDESGRRYLDFFGAAGVNLVGHSNPAVVREVATAFGGCGIGAFPTVFEQRLQSELASILPNPTQSVELFSGGAEAVEAALRAAEEYTGRPNVVGLTGGFHGKTRGARSVTQSAAPSVEGVPFATFPDCAHCPLGLQLPQCALACADQVGEIISDHRSRVAAVIVEAVQGRSGNLVVPDGYLTRLRRITRESSTLLIVDETMSGLGRTGRWLAHDADDCQPDMIILGKGLGGGYPVSALIGVRDIMHAGSFGVPSGNSSSFGGFPAAAAAAAATLYTLRTQNLVDRAAELGETMLRKLRDGLQRCSAVERVTGRGMAVGIHFNPAWRNDLTVRRFFDHCAQQGLLVMLGDRCIRLYPPLTVTDDELAHGCSVVVDAACSLAGKPISDAG